MNIVLDAHLATDDEDDDLVAVDVTVDVNRNRRMGRHDVHADDGRRRRIALELDMMVVHGHPLRQRWRKRRHGSVIYDEYFAEGSAAESPKDGVASATDGWCVDP